MMCKFALFLTNIDKTKLKKKFRFNNLLKY